MGKTNWRTPGIMLSVLFAGTLLLSEAVSAASYTVTTSSGNAIVAGSTDTGNHGDDVVTSGIAIGFPFLFFGQSFTTVNLSSNGNLQFSSSNNDYFNVALPTAAFNNMICAY